MKHLILILLNSIALFYNATGQYKLEFEIINLKSDKGSIMLELLDSNQQTVSKKIGTIQNSKSTVTIEGLRPGKYAARYFHDKNSNGKLDTRIFGIPTEGYGISNDAYGTFGPMSFEKWLIDVSEDIKTVLKTKN